MNEQESTPKTVTRTVLASTAVAAAGAGTAALGIEQLNAAAEAAKTDLSAVGDRLRHQLEEHGAGVVAEADRGIREAEGEAQSAIEVAERQALERLESAVDAALARVEGRVRSLAQAAIHQAEDALHRLQLDLNERFAELEAKADELRALEARVDARIQTLSAYLEGPGEGRSASRVAGLDPSRTRQGPGEWRIYPEDAMDDDENLGDGLPS